MNNDTPADAITQADISRQRASWEALYIDFGDYWHVEEEKMVAWAMNNVAGLFSIIDRHAEELAKHRTTSLAAQDGLVGALRILAEEIAGIEQGDQEDLKLYLALLYHLQDRIAALASIEVKSYE